MFSENNHLFVLFYYRFSTILCQLENKCFVCCTQKSHLVNTHTHTHTHTHHHHHHHHHHHQQQQQQKQQPHNLKKLNKTFLSVFWNVLSGNYRKRCNTRPFVNTMVDKIFFSVYKYRRLSPSVQADACRLRETSLPHPTSLNIAVRNPPLEIEHNTLYCSLVWINSFNVELSPKSYWCGGDQNPRRWRKRKIILHCHHQNYSALRWAAVKAILMFH